MIDTSRCSRVFRSVYSAVLICVGMFMIAPWPVWARDYCDALAPGFDGVLRLDTGGALTGPCATPPKSARPHANGASNTVPDPHSDSAQEEAPLSKKENARLNEETLRLREETLRLRAEVTRLKEQLALRDASAAAGKIESRIDQSSGGEETMAPAAKGDLLSVKPRETEILKAPAEPNNSSDVHSSNEREFDRSRNSAAGRAWRQLIDFAARVKNELSVKAPR